MTSRGNWVLVESINELTIGTTIKFVGCERCGKNCRSIVIGKKRYGILRTPKGRFKDGVSVQTTKCSASDRNQAVCEQDVADRCVYRYQLPPEATDDAEAVTRERERVR